MSLVYNARLGTDNLKPFGTVVFRDNFTILHHTP